MQSCEEKMKEIHRKMELVDELLVDANANAAAAEHLYKNSLNAARCQNVSLWQEITEFRKTLVDQPG